MVVECIAVGEGIFLIGLLIYISLRKKHWLKKVLTLSEENRRLKQDLAEKTEQMQYWRPTPETTITGRQL